MYNKDKYKCCKPCNSGGGSGCSSSSNIYSEFVKNYYIFLEANGKYAYVLKDYKDEIFEMIFKKRNIKKT